MRNHPLVFFFVLTFERNLLSLTSTLNILQVGFQVAVIGWAVILIIFTRGRLGYRHYQGDAEALDLAPAKAGQIGTVA